MGIFVSYESICQALVANANIIRAEMRKKVRLHRFFILYDNMNFYKHMRNTCIFNYGAQINYTA